MPGGDCCPSAMKYCCIACICPCIDAIVAPWDFTNSCVVAYTAPKFAINSPYNAMELLLFMAAIP